MTVKCLLSLWRHGVSPVAVSCGSACGADPSPVPQLRLFVGVFVLGPPKHVDVALEETNVDVESWLSGQTRAL